MNDDKAQLMDELTLAQQDLLAVIARAVQDDRTEDARRCARIAQALVKALDALDEAQGAARG